MGFNSGFKGLTQIHMNKHYLLTDMNLSTSIKWILCWAVFRNSGIFPNLSTIRWTRTCG